MKTRYERSTAFLRGLNPLVHPILLAIFPVVSLFQHNQAEIDLKVLKRSAPAVRQMPTHVTASRAMSYLA
jgi:hypothetical protein